jgi:hypothetical protein
MESVAAFWAGDGNVTLKINNSAAMICLEILGSGIV